MIFQVKVTRLPDIPRGATVHFFERAHQCHAYCGTFGYEMFHTTELDKVNCQRCLEKVKRWEIAA